MTYSEDDYLLLSGIQHFEFCRRQWALIHIEQQWAENLRTVEGEILHKHAHDAAFTEKRGDVIITRGMPVHSKEMGVSGQCDIVEFYRDDVNGVTIQGREGKYRVCPVEYKRGKPKEKDEDTVQLVAEAMCLEEMLCCSINTAYFYYGETRHRQEVWITDDLRGKVRSDFKEMHGYFEKKHTPNVKMTKACNACSLKELCVPKLMNKTSVRDYITTLISDGRNEETT